jgi:hypothetical protein
MWAGIFADDSTEQIVLTNCTISDMQQGLVLSNLAKLNITGNTFIDNYKCVFFNNIVGAYNSTLGNCIVRKNIFTDDATKNLLPPYSTQSKTETAITIARCSQVQIGYIDANAPDPTDKNVFENIYNGVYVITSYSNANSHQPLLFNNEFVNLHDDPAGPIGTASYSIGLFNNLYSSHRGAGVYAANLGFGPQVLSDNHYITINNVPVSAGSNFHFNNCDKAIVTNKMGLDMRNTNTDNCHFGMMSAEADGQKYLIGNQNPSNTAEDTNTFNNIHYAIQINGTPSQAHINNNYINTAPIGMLTTAAGVYPIGIAVRRYVATADDIEVRQNNITLASPLGKGISIANGGNSTLLDRNYIHMANNIKELKMGMFGTPDAIGIEVDQSRNCTLLGNHVNGPTLTTINATSPLTSAIKVVTSQNLHYECNHINNTRNGWWVQDDCGTGATDIVNNAWYHHFYGMLFTPLGLDGSLGNIGDPAINFNYNFAGNYDNDPINDSADRLYRIVSGTSNTPQPVIYANDHPAVPTSLNPSQSGSNVPSFEYYVDYTANLVLPCDPTYSIVAGDGNGGNGEEENQNIDEQNAMQLLHDSVTYYANPAVAQWLAEMRLYEKLCVDTVTREGNLTLNNFYDTRHFQATGAIREANVAIEALTSQDNIADASAFAEALSNAKAANEAIESELPYEDYEKQINTIYFITIEYGTDALSEEDKLLTEYLAKSCPLNNGNAVFKARAIWQRFQPWVNYDDLSICNYSGANKTTGAGGPFDFVMDNLNNNNSTSSQVPANNEFANVAIEVKKLNINTPFSLLPNPAQSQITIKYKLEAWQTAKVIIYDAVGAELQSIELPNFVETLTTSLNNIANGTYTYKYIVDGVTVTTNKLIVIN